MPEEQSVTDPYGSSNAPNYSPPVGYQVNPRTGALQVSIKPPPLFGILGEAATPAIQYSQNTSFLNRQILHLPLGWLYSYSFILDSKVYVNGETSFFIDQGYASGLRYYTLKDVVFQDFGDPQPFPYDGSRSFTSMLRFTTGNRQYLDVYGRLMGIDDRFGNHVIFEYDGDGDIVTSRISRIIDSLGQATLFTYTSERITVTYPRGGNNVIGFSFLLDEESYLVGYVDPLGRRTTIESRGGLARHDLVSRIAYPNGLALTYDYGTLRFYLPGRGQFHRFDCVVGVHATSAGVKRTIIYDYDPDDTAHNFTGYPTYYIDPQADRLLESGDNEYRYRVRIDDGILITEHVYNRLHLELETNILTRDSQRLVGRTVNTYPGEDSDGSFPLYIDLRRDHPNYQSPIRILAETYNDTGKKRQHVVETDFDTWGKPREVRSYRSNAAPDALLWKQTTTYDYPTDQDPNRYAIVLVEERWDYTQGNPPVDVAVRRTVNSLTPDHKSVESSATAFVSGGTFAPDRRRSFRYDSRGRITFEELAWTDGKTHDPQQSQIWTSYQDQGPSVIVTMRNVFNETDTTVFDSTTGWTTSVTNAVGASVSYTYDDLGRRIAETDPLGIVTHWSYSDAADRVTMRFANGYETYVYSNGFGDEIATADNGLTGGGERILSKKEYNSLGQLVWEEGVLAEASRLDHGYDDCGRLSSTTDQLGNVTVYKYDGAAQARTTWFNGFKVAETATLDEVSTNYSFSTGQDAGQIIMTTTTDGFNTVSLECLRSPGTEMWVETNYLYDNDLDLSRSVVRGSDGITRQFSFKRDLFGNARQESAAIERTSGVASGGIAHYNELNQLVEERNAIDQASTYTYDAAGRRKTYTDYSKTVFESSYLADSQLASVSYRSEAGDSVETRFGYDPLSHDMTSIEKRVNGQSTAVIGRSYQRDGSLTDLTYPDGNKISLVYDNQYARVSSATDALGHRTDYRYDRVGRIQSAEISGIGQQVVFEYYDRSEDAPNSGRLRSMTTNGSVRRLYEYDGFGSVAKIIFSDVRTGTPRDIFITELSYALPTRNLATTLCRSPVSSNDPSLNHRTDYTYNSQNQLVQAKVTSLPDGAVTTVVYRYDAANNVTQQVRTDSAGVSVSTTYSYDADNKLLRITGQEGTLNLSYDVNGNLVSDGRGGTYRYDRKSKLTQYINETSGIDYAYTYYPNDLRATKQENGGNVINYYYSGGNIPSIINETDANVSVSYLFAENERILRLVQESGQTSQQYLITGANDVKAVLNNTLALETNYDYDPYGAAPSGPAASGIKANPFQYTRQYTDAESELLYLRSRYYHPGLKRFLSRDPTPLLNRYDYGNGNPIGGSDPTGRVFGIDDFLIGLAIAAVVGAAIGATIGGATTKSWKGAGFGALAGLVGGPVAFVGAGAVTVVATGAIALAGIAAEEGTVLGFAIGVGTGALGEAAGGAAGGAAGQAVANLAGDNGDVGEAAWMGAIFGAVFGVARGAIRSRGIRRASGRVESEGEIEMTPLSSEAPGLEGEELGYQEASLGYQEAPWPPAPRGGRFRYTRNRRGRRVWRSRHRTAGADLRPLVRSATRRGRRVAILSGTHGSTRGGLTAEVSFYHQDVHTFQNYHNVEVYDIWALSDREVRRIVRGDREVIAAFCYSRFNDFIDSSLR